MDETIQTRHGAGASTRVFTFLLRFWLRPFMRYVLFTRLGMWMGSTFDPLCGVMAAPRGTRTVPMRFEGFAAEWVRGPGVTPSQDRGRVILYFHGGGFVAGGLRSHRRMIARLSAAAGVPALSVAYRQLPHTTLPGTVADCVTAYRYLLDEGFSPGEIVFAGDSAGGFLTFATALQAIREGLPAPGGLVAMSPFTDLDHSAKLDHANARLDPYIPGSCFPGLAKMLLGGLPLEPLHSPVNGALAAFPPTLIHCGSIEILLPDAQLMTERLAAAGVPVTLVIWDRQPHVFQIFADFCREGLRSLDEMGAFIRDLPTSAEHAA
ncbi:alpha/beta hydrolase [Actinocorallia populi]|uniref:alpha/beta hydrolase n=1 Tax=Actinocorallia populi TaxID=2079200 RepID=UPI0018E57615|nr:alpha/beta hydrolase [Actinocorallia populi]